MPCDLLATQNCAVLFARARRSQAVSAADSLHAPLPAYYQGHNGGLCVLPSSAESVHMSRRISSLLYVTASTTQALVNNGSAAHVGVWLARRVLQHYGTFHAALLSIP